MSQDPVKVEVIPCSGTVGNVGARDRVQAVIIAYECGLAGGTAERGRRGGGA